MKNVIFSDIDIHIGINFIGNEKQTDENVAFRM